MVKVDEPLKLKVINANTFAYVYKLKGESADFYTTAVPTPLANVFLKSKAAVSTIATALGPLPVLPTVAAAAPNDFNAEYATLMNMVRTVRTTIEDPYVTEDEAAVDDALEAALYSRGADGYVLSNAELPGAIRAKADLVFGTHGIDPLVSLTTAQANLSARKKWITSGIQVVSAQRSRISQALTLVGPADADVVKLKIDAADREVAAISAVAHDAILETDAVDAKMARAKKIVLQATDAATKVAGPGAPAGSFMLGPITAAGDETTLILTITPTEAYAKRVNKPGVAVPEEQILVKRRITVRGRQVLDFSAGLGYTALRNQTYFKDSGGIVREGPKDQADVQLVVLGHYITTPLGDDLAVGPALGLTATDKRFRLVAGLSMQLNSASVRGYLTVGLAFGQVDRLSGMQVGDLISGDIKTASVNRSGLFIGLTANFFSR